MSTFFRDKVALVTGGGSGIGRAVAVELARRGSRVLVTDLHLSSARETVSLIDGAGGTAVALDGDVADPSHILAAVERARDTYGALHLAVNNAGISGPVAALCEIDRSDYLRLIDVNLHSVFYGMQKELPVIVASGGGAIVNVSSVLGLTGQAFAAPYVAAKHAVAGLTKATALEYATQGVRINSVHPGYIDTALIRGVGEEFREYMVSQHPMGRLGTAAEVAHLVVFLLSDRASFVTGAQYVVDGGYLAQ